MLLGSRGSLISVLAASTAHSPITFSKSLFLQVFCLQSHGSFRGLSLTGERRERAQHALVALCFFTLCLNLIGVGSSARYGPLRYRCGSGEEL